MMRRKTLAVAAGAIVLTFFVGAAPASAYYLATYQDSGGVRTGTKYTNLGGDKKITVVDYLADGYGARGYWRATSGESGSVDNSLGANTSVSKLISGYGSIYFKACIKNGATLIACGVESVETA